MLCKYRLTEPILHCSFRPKSFKAPVQPKGKLDESLPFFLGGSKGTVYYADDAGHCTESFTCGKISKMLTFESQDLLVIITSELKLLQYKFASSGTAVLDTEVKLSMAQTDQKLQGCWVGNGLIALSAGTNSIRIWNLVEDENEILSVPGSSEQISDISFNVQINVLSAGTSSGKILLWKCRVMQEKGNQSRKVVSWEVSICKYQASKQNLTKISFRAYRN